LLPAVFHLLVRGNQSAREQDLSLEISLVLFITYILSLVFTLRTHAHLYTGVGKGEEEDEAIGREAGVRDGLRRRC